MVDSEPWPGAADTGGLTALLAGLREEMSAAACSVALRRGSELIFVAADGVGAGEVLGLRIPATQGIAGWVVVSGQGIAIADVHRDQRFDRGSAEQTGYVPTSILAVPIEGDIEDEDEGPVGVLEVLDRTPGAHDLERAAAVAAQVADRRRTALARTRLQEAEQDPELAELLALVAALGDRPAADRRLATVLLRTVLEHRP